MNESAAAVTTYRTPWSFQNPSTPLGAGSF